VGSLIRAKEADWRFTPLIKFAAEDKKGRTSSRADSYTNTHRGRQVVVTTNSGRGTNRQRTGPIASGPDGVKLADGLVGRGSVRTVHFGCSSLHRQRPSGWARAAGSGLC
jgi:hypothetical protein